jgi:hypothetical protein
LTLAASLEVIEETPCGDTSSGWGGGDDWVLRSGEDIGE